MRIVTVATSLLLCLVIAEVVANISFQRRTGEAFQYSALRDREQAPIVGNDESPKAPVFQLNPYFGYSIRPGSSVYELLEREGDPVELLRAKCQCNELPVWAYLKSNNLGFFSRFDYPVDPSGRFLVGIFGGSVAQWFSMQAEERLSRGISSVIGRDVVIVNFGVASFKQPQQLIALAYTLSIGQRFDLVLNLDGFNEAFLAVLNTESGVDSSMPSVTLLRRLELLSSGKWDERTLERLGRESSLRSRARNFDERKRHARLASTFLLYDAMAHRSRTQLSRSVTASTTEETADETMRSKFLAPLSGVGRQEQAARLWTESSRLMALLAEGAGAVYIHVLQPNQHYGSERGTVETFGRSPFIGARVQEAYPGLVAELAKLNASDVSAFDATHVFDDVKMPVYSDSCCHYNQRGNEVLADFIVSKIQEKLASKSFQ